MLRAFAANLAGFKLPSDRVFDGVDLGPVLFDGVDQGPLIVFFFQVGIVSLIHLSRLTPDCPPRSSRGPVSPELVALAESALAGSR